MTPFEWFSNSEAAVYIPAALSGGPAPQTRQGSLASRSSGPSGRMLLSPLRCLVRTALRLIDGIAGYLLGFLVVLGSRNRRRLGDMAAGTLVVRR